MGRAVLILDSAEKRRTAHRYIDAAPQNTRVEFRASKRSIPQNDRLHAMLTRFAEQLVWHGQKLDLDDWKLVMMNALNREVRAVPSLDGRGFVNLGTKTSKLTVEECTALMDLTEMYAAKLGVDLGKEAA